MIYIAALVLGFVCGLRVFTGLAVLMLSRGGLWGIVLGVAALGEYVADLMPWIPPRTKMPSIIVRPVSGFIAGHLYGTMHGADGVVAGIGGLIGALVGTFSGYSARIWLIEKIGNIPAGLAEDVIAILTALLVVSA